MRAEKQAEKQCFFVYCYRIVSRYNRVNSSTVEKCVTLFVGTGVLDGPYKKRCYFTPKRGVEDVAPLQ